MTTDLFFSKCPTLCTSFRCVSLYLSFPPLLLDSLGLAVHEESSSHPKTMNNLETNASDEQQMFYSVVSTLKSSFCWDEHAWCLDSYFAPRWVPSPLSSSVCPQGRGADPHMHMSLSNLPRHVWIITVPAACSFSFSLVIVFFASLSVYECTRLPKTSFPWPLQLWPYAISLYTPASEKNSP